MERCYVHIKQTLISQEPSEEGENYEKGQSPYFKKFFFT